MIQGIPDCSGRHGLYGLERSVCSVSPAWSRSVKRCMECSARQVMPVAVARKDWGVRQAPDL